jgi:hypothetical protein
MSNNKQSSIEWLVDRIKNQHLYPFTSLNELEKQAKAMHKEEILFAYMKTLPIEDGVFTAIDKAHEYYNEIFGGNNEQAMIDYNAMEEEWEMDNYNEMKDEQQ